MKMIASSLVNAFMNPPIMSGQNVRQSQLCASDIIGALALVYMLFLVFAYSKFVHSIYPFIALVIYAVKR